jgi:acetoin utilization protein AcuC
LARDLLLERLGDEVTEVAPITAETRDAAIEALNQLHEPEYVSRTLSGKNGEWNDTKPQVAEAGLAMFAGTMRATELILGGQARVAFNPQGAKHHARFDHGSGFCVFNDMAWAALEFQRNGLKPLYLDWDIHAGDGVYHMLKGTGVPTISIHNGSTYPMDAELQNLDGTTGELHHPEAHAYNFNLARGEGVDAFRWAIDGAASIIREYQPDVILLAAGADGHAGQGNLGEIAKFSAEGFRYAAETVATLANQYADGRVLIGGAGGYQPLKETPETWALVAETIYQLTKKDR